jgi:GYF domain 2/Domain of unknown function (DUF4282)
MSEQQWHVVIQGKGQGPFPFLTVQSMIKEGKVSKDALVWTPTMAAWTCWREVPSFAFLATAEKQPEALSQTPMPTVRPEPTAASPTLKIPFEMIPNNVWDYLSFKRMITPKLVNIFFWIGTIISVVIGLGLFIISLVNINAQGIIIGFLIMLLGPLAIRIYCELIIVFFMINETLTDISKTLEQKK